MVSPSSGYRVVWGDVHYDCDSWEDAFERFEQLEREDEHCLGQIVPILNGEVGDLVLWPRAKEDKMEEAIWPDHCETCGVLLEEDEINGHLTHECPPGFQDDLEEPDCS